MLHFKKFTQNPPLREGLTATFPATLVAKTGNNFWGGENNRMGKTLEAIRSSFLPLRKIERLFQKRIITL